MPTPSMEGGDLRSSVRKAKEMLGERGRACDVSEAELVRYFEAETLHPDLSLEEVLQNEFLVLHELVEVDEIKRMGLHLTKGVVVENRQAVFEAHLKAAEVELQIAERAGAYGHLRDRLEDIATWCEDPLLSTELKARCESLSSKTTKALSRAGRVQEREDQ